MSEFNKYTSRDSTLDIDPNVEYTNNNAQYSVESTAVRSQPTTVSVNRSTIDTSVSYQFRDIVPEGANIVKKDISVYGYLEGSKKLVSSYNNLNRKLSVDNKYENLEMGVNIEYEMNNELYRINDTVLLNKTRTQTLNIDTPSLTFETQDEYVRYLHTLIKDLSSRVLDLEQNLS